MFSESSGGLFRVTQASASRFPPAFMWGRENPHLHALSLKAQIGPVPGGPKTPTCSRSCRLVPSDVPENLVSAHSQGLGSQSFGEAVGSSLFSEPSP